MERMMMVQMKLGRVTWSSLPAIRVSYLSVATAPIPMFVNRSNLRPLSSSAAASLQSSALPSVEQGEEEGSGIELKKSSKVLLKGMRYHELVNWVESHGFRPSQALMLWKRMYGDNIWAHCAEELEGLNKNFKTMLAENAEFRAITLKDIRAASDGTKKILFTLEDGLVIETVVIPCHRGRTTVCVSSQVGCAMNCQFCYTGRMGLKRNLSAAEIVDQALYARRLLSHEVGPITNVVFMGMGEPLHNADNVIKASDIMVDEQGLHFSPRKVTISTSGLVPQMKRFLNESKCALAVSLNATTDEVRNWVMPVNRKYNLDLLLGTLREELRHKHNYKVLFEYVMLAGVNDSVEDAERLIELVRGIPCKINLLSFNPHIGSQFKPTKEEKMIEFRNVLAEAGCVVFLRLSRGDDQMAACGQLGNPASMGAELCEKGELVGDGFALSSPSIDDRRFSKHVHDNVHGNIYLDPLSLKFIDTEQFQRLRDLKQLGFSYLVYPGAVHSRFEHSLGVYWLATEAINRLRNYQGLELDIDKFDIQTVKLAGLLHDVGHGPLSHMFEREFIPKVLHGLKWSHEEMSLNMIDYIVDEHNIDIDSGSLKKVKEMVIASEHPITKGCKEKLFLYDIVANGRTGIDVDKFDYIVRDSRACGLGCNFQFQRVLETMRVIDDEICYRAKEYLTIHKLFATRADLHRTVYMHAKVKAIELMFVDAMVKANDVLHISSYIDDPARYWKLDDTILKTIETSSAEDLKESRDLIRRIRRRDLYQFCNEFAVPKDKLEHFKNVTPQDIVCSQSSSHPMLLEEDIAVSNVKIDLTRGRNNPLQRISFFKDYEGNEKFTIKDDIVSHLLPTFYQDMIVRVYSKKPHLVEAVSEAFENFQLKTYGMKTQVHATPEKKKRKYCAASEGI